MTAVRRTLLRPPRWVIVSLGLAAAALVVAVAGGRPGSDGPPLDPRSDGPLGTSALVALLGQLDADVTLSTGLPDAGDDVALVLQDRLDADQAGAVRRWVRDGGVLVVTDPGSPLAPPAAGGPGLLPGTEALDPGTCTIEALGGVGRVEAGAAVRYEVGEGQDLCFGGPADGAFVVSAPLGQGEVVAVGGAAFLTNERLDEEDNAVLAAALLAPLPGTVVRFVDPPAPAGGGDQDLVDLVPVGVERALVQLGVAFAFYALWRSIRLGRPVVEEDPVVLAGSDLVSATGRLLARTRSPGAAADLLRRGLRGRLAVRFGLPRGTDPAVVATVVSARTGLTPSEVEEAVGDRPVSTDDELLAVARAVASLDQEVPR